MRGATEFLTDDRALGLGLVLFFAALLMGSLLFIMFNPVVASVGETVSENTDDPDAERVIQERQEIWGLILFWVVFVAAMFLISRSVFESRGPG